jgi:methyl-accepting chemotaxis protein
MTTLMDSNSNQINYEEKFTREINQRANKLIEIFLTGYFLFGVGMAFYYDTWLVAISVGSMLIASYFISKMAFPGATVNQYVASAIVGVFMGQFIYQMHGMFEMHFFAFIGATLLITYQNWKVLIPLAVVIVLHHAIFGYLQYQSFIQNQENRVYFTQMNYMDLQTFIIHCFLAVIILGICGLWAYDLNKRTKENVHNIKTVEELTGQFARNLELVSSFANGQFNQPIQANESDPMGMALIELQNKLRKNLVPQT